MKTVVILVATASLIGGGLVQADGLVRPPIAYKGSLQERSQEAIIVFREGEKGKSAVEDLIIKIRVEGDASNFAWIVPLPNPPKTTKEDPKLFEELHNYVQQRMQPKPSKGRKSEGKSPLAQATPKDAVRVISRKIVGAFDVAVVRENARGVLNSWLEKEGFQPIEGGEKLIEEYRRKGYVFACTKVSNVTLEKGATLADLHPLRFTFETGGRDGIYFPMRITGLQSKSFDINLYVFYRAWLNDGLNNYGYEKQGFTRNFRDWDTAACKPNAGKSWWNPGADPYLKDLKRTIPTVTKFFKERHSGKRFYLTNIQAHSLKPSKVLSAKNDLWLFPYYTDTRFVPFDKRDGGPALD
jgi:hypothetical protein